MIYANRTTRQSDAKIGEHEHKRLSLDVHGQNHSMSHDASQSMSLGCNMEQPLNPCNEKSITFEEKMLNMSQHSAPRSAIEELNDIVTPIKADRLNFWLQGYEGRQELVDDFTYGFDIGCIQEPDFLDEEHNCKMALEHEEVVDKFLEKEIKAAELLDHMIVNLSMIFMFPQ